MKNFGFSDLYLVTPRTPINKTAYNYASHAKDILDNAHITNNLQDAITGCKIVLGTTARERASDGYDLYTPRQAARTYPTQNTAIMFGPEDFGLSNEELDYCQGYIRIPTAEYASLNLAQAVQLIVYEFFTNQQENDLSRTAELAPREELEGMYAHLMTIAHTIGYTDKDRHHSTEHLFRRIFDRAELTPREVAAVRGLWRQVAWAAKQNPEKFPLSQQGH